MTFAWRAARTSGDTADRATSKPAGERARPRARGGYQAPPAATSSRGEQARDVADAHARAHGRGASDDFERDADVIASGARAAPGGAEAARAMRGRDGATLPSAAREYFEAKVGVDLGAVRLHSDERGARVADAVDARAVTAGDDVYFAAGELDPGSARGAHLLAHELAHVAQQRAGGAPTMQRDPKDKPPSIPADLLTSPDLKKMKESALIKRYDDLSHWYFDVKGLKAKENAKLKKGIADVGGELARRALAAGRTFAIEDVQKMKEYFMDTIAQRQKMTDENGEEEAKKHFACINVLRAGMSKLYGNTKGLTMTKNNTMEETMEQLHEAGRASDEHVIKFVSKSGKAIEKGGGAHPVKPETSIWDYLISEVKRHGDIGYSVFGLSLMDGLHSVTLTVDYRNPRDPTVRFTDHSLHHGKGWEGMKREPTGHAADYQADSPRGLDEYITHFVEANWTDDAQDNSTPWIRLWRLNQ